MRRLELFGSATNGRFDATSSDLDFLVEFQPLGPVDRADAYFGLLAALQDLFQRDVDLVETEAINNPYFRKTATSSGWCCMTPEVLKFLHDVEQACWLIEQFTSGKSIENFQCDVQLRSAVERQFITIGEALQQ